MDERVLGEARAVHARHLGSEQRERLRGGRPRRHTGQVEQRSPAVGRSTPGDDDGPADGAGAALSLQPHQGQGGHGRALRMRGPLLHGTHRDGEPAPVDDGLLDLPRPPL